MNHLSCTYTTGQLIFEEGSKGDMMFIIEDGTVEICLNQDGKRKILNTLDRGEIFGEMALVDDSPRCATAVAGPGGACLIAIDSSHFIFLVTQQPAFALKVLSVMATRLRNSNYS